MAFVFDCEFMAGVAVIDFRCFRAAVPRSGEQTCLFQRRMLSVSRELSRYYGPCARPDRLVSSSFHLLRVVVFLRVTSGDEDTDLAFVPPRRKVNGCAHVSDVFVGCELRMDTWRLC